MMPNTFTIPLFPLNTVLFPGAKMPLQIFEKRYLAMLRDCIAANSKFGIVLIKEGTEVGDPAIPYTVGTIARIISSQEVYKNRMLISVMGERRFKIKKILRNRPYISAEIDIESANKKELITQEEIERFYARITRHINLALHKNEEWIKTPKFPTSPKMLSYFIAQTLDIDLFERQKLLSEPSYLKQLEICKKHMDRESDELIEKISLEMINGFRHH